MAKSERIVELFPTQVYRSRLSRLDIKRFNSALLKEALVYSKVDQAGIRWSRKNYPGGYTSYSSVSDLPFRSSNFLKLKRWIDGEVGRFSRSLDLDLDGGRLEMTSCWLNVMGPMAHHSYHVHPLSTVSGTYYVQVPKDSGSFKIEDPRMTCFMASPPRKPKSALRNQRHVSLEAQAGDLLLFESWMRHEVPAHRGTEPRVSVSFNYDWVRSS